MYTHANTRMHTHHPKRIIYFNGTIKDERQSYSSHAHVVGGMVITYIERIREASYGDFLKLSLSHFFYISFPIVYKMRFLIVRQSTDELALKLQPSATLTSSQ